MDAGRGARLPPWAAKALAAGTAACLALAWRHHRSKKKAAQLRRAAHRRAVPKRLIIVRHGESQGNVDKRIYESTADSLLHLTEDGWQQTLAAGCALKDIVKDEHVAFAVSPYVRTRETFNAVSQPWGGPNAVDWIEDPRLREQDFGNFQDVEAMDRSREERGKFGPFYYRMPSGESPADVYDRVSSFFETMHRRWKQDTRIDELNYVLVVHGVTISVFLMRLFKYSVDDFHKYANFENAEFCVLETQPSQRCEDTRWFDPSALYCVRQVQKNGMWVSEKGDREVRRDANRYVRPIHEQPPSMLSSIKLERFTSRLERSSASRRPEFVVKTFSASEGTGFRCDDALQVETVLSNSQADRAGVMLDWHLEKVNGVLLEFGVTNARDALKAAKATGKPYELCFRVDPGS